MRLIEKALAGTALAALLSAPAAGQTRPPGPVPIQDNSFLLEEAYNQEAGVVQTIQTFTRVAGTGDWVWTLTQEWPVPDQKNQLSATIPFLGNSGTDGFSRGLGDVQLNYRYQLVGSGEARLAVAPRATLLLPSGDYRRGLGSGAVGLQVGVPLSVVLSDRLVIHTNVGGTILFSAKNGAGEGSDLRSVSAGQSVIWLAHPSFNVMLEAVAASNEIFGDDGVRARRTEIYVSPGIRAAWNLPGNLQIVPGVAVPFGVGPSAGRRSLLLYFSVELPVF